MKAKINYQVAIEIVDETDSMTLDELERLGALHIQNCINDNPDADICTITECDACIINGKLEN
jgi:hypothetical protein